MGQHWHGVFRGGCGGSAVGMTPPAWFELLCVTSCADVAGAEMRLEEAVSVSYMPG